MTLTNLLRPLIRLPKVLGSFDSCSAVQKVPGSIGDSAVVVVAAVAGAVVAEIAGAGAAAVDVASFVVAGTGVAEGRQRLGYLCS